MLIVHLVVAGIFLVLGTVFAFGKGAFLIAGYNTASAEEKAQYDEKKLCRAVSKLMFALAACWVVAALSEIFKNMIFLWVGIALFAVVIVVGVVWINIGDRCKSKIRIATPRFCVRNPIRQDLTEIDLIGVDLNEKIGGTDFSADVCFRIGRLQ